MTVHPDTSPLITPAKIGQLDLLRRLHGEIFITRDVYVEATDAGNDLGDGLEIAASLWIRVSEFTEEPYGAQPLAPRGLGAGEVSTVRSALRLKADLVIMDDRAARRHAESFGLDVIGCIGIWPSDFGVA